MQLTDFKNKFSKYSLIICIILVLFLVLAGTIIFRRNATNKSGNSQPVKVIPSKQDIANLPSDTKKIRQKILEGKEIIKGKDLTLYKDDNYEIEYVPTPDIFFVKILRDPVQIYKNQAQDWFINFGLKQTDLCTFPVRFFLDFKLKKTNPNFSALPDGCKP